MGERGRIWEKGHGKGKFFKAEFGEDEGGKEERCWEEGRRTAVAKDLCNKSDNMERVCGVTT